MKELGYGKEYIYPPSDPSSAAGQTYLPPSLLHHKFLEWPEGASGDFQDQEHRL
jgi:putative ATPase